MVLFGKTHRTPSKPRARYFVSLFLLAIALLSSDRVAHANQVDITVKGTVFDGGDPDGTFGPVGANLAGDAFTELFHADDGDGTPGSDGKWPACTNGLVPSGLSQPIPITTLTINGKSFDFGARAESSTTGQVQSVDGGANELGLSQDTEEYFPAFTDIWGGNEQVGSAITLLSIPTGVSCRNWESAFTYTLNRAKGDTNYGGFAVDSNTNALNSAVTVTSISISNPYPIPKQSKINPQNYGCSCSQNNEQSAQAKPLASLSRGDPINAGVGNMVMHETDFVGGPATHLSFTRWYNSFDTADVGLGVGWRSTYHHGLAVTATAITVTSADGRQDIFTHSGSSFVPEANVTSVLEATSTGYALKRPDDTTEFYNGSGQLTSIEERSGLTTTLAYTTSGLASVKGPFGHTLSFTYDGSHRVTSMTLPDGTNKYSYAYDQNDNLAFVINPDGTAHQFEHGDWPFLNLITQLDDEDGNPYAEWTYDSEGRATSSQHAAGVDAFSLAYTGSTSVTGTDALGNKHTYALATNYGLVQPSAVTGVPDPSVGGAAFTYDANGFLASSKDYNGNLTEYVHNSLGEETSRTEAAGTSLSRTTVTKWHPTFHLPVEIDAPLGRTTTFGYDSHGNMLTKGLTDGVDNRTWSWTYNSNSQVTSATDPLDHTTKWTYDVKGDVATEVDALGHTTTYNAYDANGRLISLTDANGLTTTYSYDTLGRMTSKKVGGLTTSYTWDSGVNAVKQVIYPDGTALNYGFDDAHRLISVTNGWNRDKLSYTYDDNSNLTKVQALNSSTSVFYSHTYTYDSQNRMLTSDGAYLGETTTYNYDSQSNLMSIEDANGHFIVTNTYDDLNRLSTSENPYSGITTYNYDAEDDVTSIKDPFGLTTTYTYNGIGDLLKVQSPQTGTSTFKYNAAGLLLTTTDARGKTASYQYDALNRTTTISYSSGLPTVYSYDTGTYGIGHLTKMVDPAGTTTWGYDQFGQVIGKAQTANSLTLTTTYTYDGYHRPSTIKYPSGKVVSYGYDAGGRITYVSPGLSNLTYIPFGPMQSWDNAYNYVVARTIDLDGRIAGVALNSTTNKQTLTFDPAGNITALSETGTAGNKTYGYDSFNRLTRFFNNTTTTSYTYDINGNRTSSTVLGKTTTYTYSPTTERLTNLGGTTTYSYDASGNTIGDGANTWTYDARGRMSTLLAGTTTASYGINGLGQRITKAGSDVPYGGKNEFVYDEQGNLLGEYGSTGTMIEETVYLPDTPVPVMSKGFGLAEFGAETPIAVLTGSGGGTVSSITPDWLGAPHIITNGNNQYLWFWDHYAFGDNAPNQNPAGLGPYIYNGRLRGQYKDIETNLNYNWFRDYNPATGRYVQSDPLGQNAGVNTYAYVGGNPLTRIDPMGRQGCFMGVCQGDNYPTEAPPGGLPSWPQPPAPNMFDQYLAVWTGVGLLVFPEGEAVAQTLSPAQVAAAELAGLPYATMGRTAFDPTLSGLVACFTESGGLSVVPKIAEPVSKGLYYFEVYKFVVHTENPTHTPGE